MQELGRRIGTSEESAGARARARRAGAGPERLEEGVLVGVQGKLDDVLYCIVLLGSWYFRRNRLSGVDGGGAIG